MTDAVEKVRRIRLIRNDRSFWINIAQRSPKNLLSIALTLSGRFPAAQEFTMWREEATSIGWMPSAT
jgi:hypothetical protein